MGSVVRDVWNVTQFADNAQSQSQTRDYPTAVTQAERDMGECGEENSDAWKLEVDRRNTAKNTACAEVFRNSCNRTILATARNAGIILDTAERPFEYTAFGGIPALTGNVDPYKIFDEVSSIHTYFVFCRGKPVVLPTEQK